MTAHKIRVAILGGGPAGLATALELSATPELRARFDVAVYQAGWRVGGKCGQGRKGPANRIEINGTHYLFGGYHAVFDVARQVFDDLKARGDARFGTYDEQFLPCSTVVVKHEFNGVWQDWVLHLPGDGRPPDSPGRPLTLGDALRTLLGWLLDAATGAPGRAHLDATATRHATGVRHWWQRLCDWLGFEVRRVGIALLHEAERLVRGIEHEIESPVLRNTLIGLLRAFRGWAREMLAGPAQRHVEAWRLRLLLDLGCSMLIGMLQDDVFAPGGFENLDDIDLRDWLVRSGALVETANSPPIVTWYNAIAAYEGGNIATPNMSAGIGLRGLLRLGLTYRGAFSFQLTREVGDSLIAPLYQVLKDRGVRFLFFHRVRDVVPTADGRGIAQVLVERQVTLTNGPESYEPFIVPPDGHPAWPDSPLVEQFDGPAPDVGALDSFYTPRVGPLLTLERGRDFDVAVYAMPVATAQWYAARLCDQNERWRSMVNGIGTTETQSLRLWFKPTVEQMGWTHGQCVLSGYYQPLATWEDARQLVATESWPANLKPGGIQTLFGALGGMPDQYPGPDDTDYPATRDALAREHAVAFCNHYVGSLWPLATANGPNGPLNYELLVTLDQGLKGGSRLLAQSIRANAGPVEAYTQIRKGTLRYRMRVDDTGYDNLLIAGDWVRNDYDVGSVEGAVLAGQQAAAALIARNAPNPAP